MALVSAMRKRKPILGYARKPTKGADMKTTDEGGSHGEVITQA